MDNILEKIEKENRVDAIKCNNIKVWPFIRYKFYASYVAQNMGVNTAKHTRNIYKLLRNAFRNIYFYLKLKKFDYWFFNNSEKRYLIDGKNFEAYFDTIADFVGQKRSVFFERDENLFYKNCYSENCCSNLPFRFFAAIISKFIRVRIQNEEIIKNIKKVNNIQLDHLNIIKSEIATFCLFNYVFRKNRPKAVFLICNYAKNAIIAAARYNKIPVYEVQHGYVSNVHALYNIKGRFSDLFFPKMLIAWGNIDKESRKKLPFLSSEKIFVAGSFYLHYIKENYSNDILAEIRKKYKNIFCIALQAVFEKEILDYSYKLSKLLPDSLFIIRSRFNSDKELIRKYINANIITLDDFNIYQVLKYCNYNITICSTVAVEAAYLNVRNILFNIDGLSEKYLNPDHLAAKVINSPFDSTDMDELLDIPQNNLSNFYFASGYEENIRRFVSLYIKTDAKVS